MVSKWCWENGTLGLLHFELPHILELWKMQHLPHSKGKHSKTRPALYCSLGSGVVRTKSQLSSLPPTHTHTHTHNNNNNNTQSHSQTKCYLFLIFLTTSCSSPRSFPAICPLFRSCLTVYSFPCAPLTWTVKKLEPQILHSAVCPDGCRCLVLGPRSFFCLIIHSCLSRLPVPRVLL